MKATKEKTMSDELIEKLNEAHQKDGTHPNYTCARCGAKLNHKTIVLVSD